MRLPRHPLRVLPLLLAAAAPAFAQTEPQAPAVRAAATVPLNAVVQVTATGPSGVPARLEILRSGRWVRHGPGLVLNPSGERRDLRADRIGALRIRLAHGPALRDTTPPVTVRVVRTGRPRVVAGHTPVQALVDGRDLWVFAWNPGTRRPELRLLDARTGGLIRGPVHLRTDLSWDDVLPPLVLAGGIPLLDSSLGALTGPAPLTALEERAPGLLGASVRFLPGTCAATCTPNRIRVRGRSIPLAASAGAGLAPVRGPDGRLWDLAPATNVPWEDERADRLLTRPAPAAAPSAVGVPGPMGPGHAGLRGSLQAVRGGAWVTTIEGRTWWASPVTGLTSVAVRDIHLAAGCTWGYRAAPAHGPAPALVRLMPAGRPTGDAVPLPHGRVAVGERVAWVVSGTERTLIRVPLPAC